MTLFLITGLVAFITSLAVAFTWAKTGQRIGFIDKPGSRSSHVNPTPRGGGVGIVIAVPIATLVAVSISPSFSAGSLQFLLPASLAGLVLAGLSFYDDFRPISAKVRLVVHVLLAAVVVGSLRSFVSIDLPGVAVPIASGLAGFLAIGWLLATINLTNFMDGIDGLAGIQAVCAGTAWAVLGLTEGDSLTGVLGLAVAAAAGGFLVVNWHPAKVFLGDVGSAYLGLVFGTLPLVFLKQENNSEGIAVFSALVIWPFLADGFSTFFRRLLRRENVFEAHRTHLYQRLVIAGWSHAKVALLYAGWSACTAVLGFLYLKPDVLIRSVVILTAAISLPVIVAIVKKAEAKIRA